MGKRARQRRELREAVMNPPELTPEEQINMMAAQFKDIPMPWWQTILLWLFIGVIYALLCSIGGALIGGLAWGIMEIFGMPVNLPLNFGAGFALTAAYFAVTKMLGK